jgi:hypothetical protein
MYGNIEKNMALYYKPKQKANVQNSPILQEAYMRGRVYAI